LAVYDERIRLLTAAFEAACAAAACTCGPSDLPSRMIPQTMSSTSSSPAIVVATSVAVRQGRTSSNEGAEWSTADV